MSDGSGERERSCARLSFFDSSLMVPLPFISCSRFAILSGYPTLALLFCLGQPRSVCFCLGFCTFPSALCLGSSHVLALLLLSGVLPRFRSAHPVWPCRTFQLCSSYLALVHVLTPLIVFGLGARSDTAHQIWPRPRSLHVHLVSARPSSLLRSSSLGSSYVLDALSDAW